MKKLILFDMDGTLIDSAFDLAAAVNDMRKKRNLPVIPAGEFREAASVGSVALLSVGFGITPEDPGFSDLRTEFFESYRSRCTRSPQFFPGVRTMLSGLYAADFVWGIVTNKPHEFACAICEAESVLQTAAVVIGAQDGLRPKPAPDGILKALSETGTRPENCVYLGDDLRDTEAASAAGVTPAFAEWGYLGAERRSLIQGAFSFSSPQEFFEFAVER